MFDPSNRIHRGASSQLNRRGAVVPMFAIILPVLLILCGFAINLAYMQVVSTELKIATDCAAHAGGRAMSLTQSNGELTVMETRDLALQRGMEMAETIASANEVYGRALSVGQSGSGSEIEIGFGRSARGDNGRGMFEYTEIPLAEILSGDRRPASLRVTGQMDLPMIFQAMSSPATSTSPARTINSFAPMRTSVATQVDRDVALVLDRSGSMAFFKDEEGLEQRIRTLHATVRNFNFYYFSRDRSSQDFFRGRWVERGSSVPRSWNGPFSSRNFRLISTAEANAALGGLTDRRYTDNVIYQLERWENDNHTLGLRYSESFQNSSAQSDFDPQDVQSRFGDRNELTVPKAQYARDFDNAYRLGAGAPRHSRWTFLEQGVEAFLRVLETTDQGELVSLVTFNNSATLDLNLQEETDDTGDSPFFDGGYPNVRRRLNVLRPAGGTAVGDGLLTGLPPLIPRDNEFSLARPFAARTIVVLTDGVSNAGTSPGDAVEEIVGEADVTIHAVTFTRGADQAAMQEVAEAGNGRHYHDDDGQSLVQIFEEIANNLPTILTE